MSYNCRPNSEEFYFAAKKALKDLRVLSVGSNFHVDKTTTVCTGGYRDPVPVTLTVASPNASDLATLLTLCAEIRAVILAHAADDCSHKVADTTLAGVAAAPTDLATAITFLNDAKSKYGTHIASTTFHYTADATNTIAAANASDQASSQTLANEIKTDLTAHIAGAPSGHGVRFIGP